MKITGKTLIDLGYKPGKWFGDVIEYANKHQLEGKDLINYLEKNKPPPSIDPYSEPSNYHKNIKAETEEERANIGSVVETMNELMKTPTLVNGALMPDACPTGEKGQIPVGGVAVAENAIHPSMHSADICCSVMMTNLGMIEPKTVLDKAMEITHFGGGGRDDVFDMPADLESEIKDNHYLNDQKSIELSKHHLGTQGDGNHFLFVGMSERTGETIIVTHHGSRGFGARLYKKGMQIAEKFRREISPKTLKRNAWIPFEENEGQQYWNALQTIRKWTKQNHYSIHENIFRNLKVDPVLNFWNEHNFIFKDGSKFYHAKGATPLDDKFLPDSYEGLRLIPLNMSEPVLIVKGETTENNIGFAPHGAGRNVSRTQHKRNKEGKSLEQIMYEETKDLDIRFYSGNPDISELPSAYKNADNVQQQMKDFNLGQVVDKIIPYGCIMAGDWLKDAPWRKNKRKK